MTEGKKVLDLPMAKPNDADAETVRGYFRELLSELWREGESFSGKRPLGNSGWQDDLYKPLIAAGMVAGEIDDDGYVRDVDSFAADELIAAAIREL